MTKPPEHSNASITKGALACPVPGCCQSRSVGALLCPGHAATVDPWLMQAADKALAAYQTEPVPLYRPGRLDHLQRCNSLVIQAAQEASALLS